MSLTKLFNFKYLKENIKKSRGILFLICVLVPVFTTLYVTLNLNYNDEKIVAEQYSISLINIFGMFFIPIIISFNLFGYVFKKNSVDLINSMPLKRSTIFITNTIGGIILITLFQAITAFLLLVCSIFSQTAYIFPAMIWDVFVMMWVTYVFIFVSANIAMSISGTFTTQCAVTLLIIFLIPFCIVSFYKFDDGMKTVYTENGENIANFVRQSVSNNRVFTMPSSIIYNGLSNGTIYISRSIIRTMILSVVYIFIGLKLFEKRKMENAEESFESTKIHLFIKALTMIPMITVLHFMEESAFSMILYALVIVYYFAYDFVVKKKIPVRYSLPVLVVVILCLEGICSFSDYAYDKFNFSKKTIEKNDVKEIAIDCVNFYTNRYSYINAVNFSKNKELIDTVFDIIKKRQSDTEEEEQDYKIVTIILRNNLNEEVILSLSLSNEELDRISEIIHKDGYIEELKKDYTRNGIITFDGSVINDDKILQEIDDELKFAIENMDIKQLNNFTNSNATMLLKKSYVNHKLVTVAFPINTTNKILELFAEYENKKSKEVISKISQETMENWYDMVSIQNELKDMDEAYYGNYYFSYYGGEIVKYLSNNLENKFDSSKEYYFICINYNTDRNYMQLYYFTNDIKPINEIVKKDIKKVERENNEYYERLQNEYDMVVTNIKE